MKIKILNLCSVMIALLVGGNAAADDIAKKELTPTGKLRAGLVIAPSLSLLFNVKEANGRSRGITTDLADELGKKLNVPVERVLVLSSGLATDALEAGNVDVSFVPVDEQRKKRIAFGPVYVYVESTYMVTIASGAKTIEDVDRPGMRVVAIANTATIRLLERTLKNATISPVNSVTDAVAVMSEGKADAVAGARDSLPSYLKQVPGSRIVDGAFHQLPIAIAVAKNKPIALAYVTEFLESAKRSGLLRRTLDRHGFHDPVAP